jgi:nucleoside-diphosphate-sugar epimerase
MMPTALVTGATGFLGHHLVVRLLALGYRTIAVGRNPQKGAALQQLGAEFASLDFADETAITAACKGVDFVFHCGALSTHSAPKKAYYHSNVIGTKSIIAACKANQVKRLIHVSTPSLYFHYDARMHVKESDPLPHTFANEYAHTKQLAEQLVDAAHLEGLPVITIRPRAIFGEGDQALMPNLFEANAKTGVPLFNHGRALMDVTYVSNVVDALLLCMTADERFLGQKYNITNGEPRPFIAILEAVFQASGVPLRTKPLPYGVFFGLAGLLELVAKVIAPSKKVTLTRYTVSVLGKSQTLSIEKAKAELRYVPSVSLDEGIRRYGQWVKERQSWN